MQKSFLKAATDFFGLHAGQTPMQFGKECLSLNDADKKEIRSGIVTATGWDVAEIKESPAGAK